MVDVRKRVPVDEPFTEDTDGVEREEEGIAEPEKEVGRRFERDAKVKDVANDVCEGPCVQKSERYCRRVRPFDRFNDFDENDVAAQALDNGGEYSGAG